nr:hypothetical protein [Planctomycetota bacterium]
MLELDDETFRADVQAASRAHYRGSVERVSGMLVEAGGVPAAMGELCRINRGPLRGIDAEGVGFRGQTTLLMPHGDLHGISPMQTVTALGRSFTVTVGQHLLGATLDGFGTPLVGSNRANRAPDPGCASMPVHADPPP